MHYFTPTPMHYFTPTCCEVVTTVAALPKSKPQAGQMQMSHQQPPHPVLLVSLVTLLLTPAHCITLESGPLCPGQRATVHCNITGGTLLTWQYGSDQLVSIVPALGSLPPDDPVMAGGVAFTVSLVSTTPDLVSEISFVVSSIINGMILVCSGVDASGAVSRNVTLQENAAGKQMKASI